MLTSVDLPGFLDELDAFEGDEYERATAQVVLDSGNQVHAYLYVLKPPAKHR